MPPLNVEYCITVTLPPSFYKIKAMKQLPVLKQALSLYAINFFDFLEGYFELTQKGNVHFHGCGIFRHQECESQDIARMKFIDNIRVYSRTLVELPKTHMKKWMDYAMGDIKITAQVMECSPKLLHYKYVRPETISLKSKPLSPFSKILKEEFE